MPRAVVTTETTDKILLKSCPDGYIVLRALSYGEYLARQEMAMKMSIAGGEAKSLENIDFAVLQKKVAEFEFSRCVVDHNLDDENDKKLDFTRPGTLDRLDPKVGQEVAQHIEKLIQFEEDLGN
jgi:hypothetical protein